MCAVCVYLDEKYGFVQSTECTVQSMDPQSRYCASGAAADILYSSCFQCRVMGIHRRGLGGLAPTKFRQTHLHIDSKYTISNDTSTYVCHNFCRK